MRALRNVETVILGFENSLGLDGVHLMVRSFLYYNLGSNIRGGVDGSVDIVSWQVDRKMIEEVFT